MTHELVNDPHTSNNEKIRAPLTQERVLEILSEVVPHMPTESQASFISMFRDKTSSLSSREAPEAPPRHAPRHACPFLLPDPLHHYVQEKTIQHLFESDLAFEAKQQAATKTPRGLRKSKGITKPYDKARENQVRKKRARIVFPVANPHTMPPRIPWANAGAIVSVNGQTFGMSLRSVPHFYPADMSSVLRKGLPT